MKTVEQILTEARDTIAKFPDLLVSGDLVKHNDENQLCFCALGYIALATNECTVVFTEYNDPVIKVAGLEDKSHTEIGIYDWLNDHPAVIALAEVIGTEPNRHNTATVFEFNDDHAGSRPELVIEMFTKAIEAQK